MLSSHSYGKADIPVSKIVRRAGQPDEFIHMYVKTNLYGCQEKSYTDADNSTIVATDTQKNIVYKMAGEHDFTSPERFALIVASYILNTYNHVIDEVHVDVDMLPYERLQVGGQGHHHGFQRAGHNRTARAVLNKSSAPMAKLWGGVKNWVILKTAKAGFEGYIRDANTLLPPTTDRILATEAEITWQYTPLTLTPPPCCALFDSEAGGHSECDGYNNDHQAITSTLVAAFAGPADTGVYSPSVQQTLYDMGRAVITTASTHLQVDHITLSLPNRHHIPFGAGAKLGLPDNNELFVPSPQPSGVINATVSRTPLAKL